VRMREKYVQNLSQNGCTNIISLKLNHNIIFLQEHKTK